MVSDYLTKWSKAYPTRDMEATTVARILVDKPFCYYGMPDCIQSDQGWTFESTVVGEMCSLLGITKTQTTPYNLQSDGLVECMNRTLLAMLSIAAGKDEHNWDLHLPKLMFAYRTCAGDYSLYPFQPDVWKGSTTAS